MANKIGHIDEHFTIKKMKIKVYYEEKSKVISK